MLHDTTSKKTYRPTREPTSLLRHLMYFSPVTAFTNSDDRTNSTKTEFLADF